MYCSFYITAYILIHWEPINAWVLVLDWGYNILSLIWFQIGRILIISPLKCKLRCHIFILTPRHLPSFLLPSCHISIETMNYKKSGTFPKSVSYSSICSSISIEHTGVVATLNLFHSWFGHHFSWLRVPTVTCCTRPSKFLSQFLIINSFDAISHSQLKHLSPILCLRVL